MHARTRLLLRELAALAAVVTIFFVIFFNVTHFLLPVPSPSEEQAPVESSLSPATPPENPAPFKRNNEFLVAVLPFPSEARLYIFDQEKHLTFWKTLQLNKRPVDAAFADGLLYVAVEQDNEGWIQAWDLAQPELRREYRTGSITSLAVGKNHLFAIADDDVLLIDKETAEIARVPVDGSPLFLEYVSSLDNVFVGMEDAPEIVMINPRIASVAKIIRVSGFPQDMAVTGDQRILTVATQDDDVLSLVPLNLLRQTQAVITGQEPAAVVAGPDGRLLFVANSHSNDVSVIILSQVKRLLNIPVGSGPTELAVHPDGSAVVAFNSGEGSLSVIDMDSLQERQRLLLSADVVALLMVSEKETETSVF